MNQLLTSVKTWASHPFTSGMDVKGWALFTGLVVCLVILWIMVIRDLQGEI